MITVTDSQKRALSIATIIALVFGVYFLKNYILLVFFAGIVALLFNPLYKRMLHRGAKPATAASLTLVGSILAVVIPVVVIGAITTFQVISLAGSVGEISKTTDLSKITQDVLDTFNETMDSKGIPYHLQMSQVVDFVSNALKKIGESLASGALSSLSSITAFFAAVIIYCYVFLSLLKNQKRLVEAVHNLNPLGRKIGTLYINKASAMTKAMVRGQFVIAACQGLVGSIFIYIAGLHDAFFFLLVVLTALSIIPLGGGVVALPIGVIMLLTGNIWGGLLVILSHLLIVTNIDNILRPILVPREARLDPALTILAVFSGLKLWGFIGIVLGPVLMIILVTTIRVFMDAHKDDQELLSDTNKPKFKKSWVSRIFRRNRKAEA